MPRRSVSWLLLLHRAHDCQSVLSRPMLRVTSRSRVAVMHWRSVRTAARRPVRYGQRRCTPKSRRGCARFRVPDKTCPPTRQARDSSMGSGVGCSLFHYGPWMRSISQHDCDARRRTKRRCVTPSATSRAYGHGIFVVVTTTVCMLSGHEGVSGVSYVNRDGLNSETLVTKVSEVKGN